MKKLARADRDDPRLSTSELRFALARLTGSYHLMREREARQQAAIRAALAMLAAEAEEALRGSERLFRKVLKGTATPEDVAEQERLWDLWQKKRLLCAAVEAFLGGEALQRPVRGNPRMLQASMRDPGGAALEVHRLVQGTQKLSADAAAGLVADRLGVDVSTVAKAYRKFRRLLDKLDADDGQAQSRE